MYATAIISKIIKEKSGNLYIYPGGTIAPLLHECKKDNINLIVSKHEQGAGYMALSEALLYHKPSFLTVTSGPGATNIITTIADAYYDSIPLIILTGQVGTADLNRSSKLRQRGFQEVPIINMTKDITKKVFQPRNVKELSDAIHDAYIVSNSQRKGPVLIDLPMDVQLKKITDTELKTLLNLSKLTTQNIQNDISIKQIEASIDIINSSKKPVFLIGGGAQEEWATIREFIKKTNIPAISSLRGLGIVEEENFHGWIGHTGSPWTNEILYEADTVIVLGSRLDVRQTGTQTDILNQKNVIHIDIDKHELEESRIESTIKLNVSISKYIELTQLKINILKRKEWKEDIKCIKNQNNYSDVGSQNGMNPKDILEYINQIIQDKKTYITTGVGSHQHWAARYIQFDNQRCKLFTSAGHGTMGFSLPVAIGLKNLEQDTQVICIDGDGSFQMNIQELALIKELNLNVKILLLDNNRLGIVSQFQQITFHDDPTTGDVKNPDFIAIAQAYGIEAYSIKQLDTDTIGKWISSNKASLLHVSIKHDAPISPMLLGGQNLNEMWKYEN